MFRAGLLLRALPSILAELVGLVWYGYRSGNRAAAAAALTWLATTVALLAFAIDAVLSVLTGGEVQLRGPFLVASLPIAIWLARELMGILMLVVGWLISLFGPERARIGL